MEQLQEAYVYAVASTSGCTVETKRRDIYGIDLEIKKPVGPGVEELTIYFQLKNTTTIAPDHSKSDFPYQFKKRTYMEHLAMVRTNPKALLLVMVTDPDQSRWTSCADTHMSMTRCCYWMNLEGAAVPVAQSPTVRVPTAQIFDAAALNAMFDRLQRGKRI
jgi:hypothetical protein